MKKIKKVIIYLAIIILILIIVLSVILLIQKNDSKTFQTTANLGIDTNTQNILLLKDESEYQDIKRIFNKYISYINYLDYNQFQVKLNDNQQKKIKEEYLKKGEDALENIMIEKALNNRDWIKMLASYSRKKINILEINKLFYNNMLVYLLTIEYDKKNTDNIIVFIDEKNESFSILPDKIWKKISKENLVSLLDEINIEQIEKNNYNEVKKIKLDEEKICLQYYYDYLDLLRNDPDKLYEKLNKEYREKRFENIENFKKYINDNKEMLQKSILSNYQVKDINDYKEYTCVDENGKYYVFCATAAMKYTLYLDTYTVDLPEFTEKYNSANDQEKVILNIGKVISAINNDDFKYFYNKLADSFKNNYFENEDALKNYWLDNLYKKNKVEFMDFNREGNLYTYKLKITKQYEEGEESTFGKDSPSSFINIVMQLKEGTDFVMSFSVLEQ